MYKWKNKSFYIFLMSHYQFQYQLPGQLVSTRNWIWPVNRACGLQIGWTYVRVVLWPPLNFTCLSFFSFWDFCCQWGFERTFNVKVTYCLEKEDITLRKLTRVCKSNKRGYCKENMDDQHCAKLLSRDFIAAFSNVRPAVNVNVPEM